MSDADKPLIIYAGTYHILGFPADEVLDQSSVDFGQFVAISYAPEAVTLICPEEQTYARASIKSKGWRVIQRKGAFQKEDMDAVQKIANLLSAYGIDRLAVAQTESDYLLVHHDQWERAAECLKQSGYVLELHQ